MEQDRRLDIEAKLDESKSRDTTKNDEICSLKDVIQGKDEAIKSLGASMMAGGKENERLAEMVSQLKNKLVTETVFHTSFVATLKSSSTTFSGIKTNHEVLLSFLRDPEEEEEFFLEVTSKKDDEIYHRIPVDNIDEIEHVEGTLKLYLHY